MEDKNSGGKQGQISGIFDNSADLHRAIAMTDAYFGDPSSVVTLYMATGKPLMYSSQDNNLNSIISRCPCFYNNKLVMSAYYWNYLVNIDLDTGKTTSENIFVNADCDARMMLYYGTYECDDRIFFSPYSASEIAVFDKVAKKVDYISLENFGGIPENSAGFSVIVRFENSLYFVPIDFGGILEYKLDTNEIVVHNGWEEEIDAIAFGKLTYAKLCGFANVNGSKLLCPCANANAYLEFDMKTHNWSVEIVGREKLSYNSITIIDDTKWLIGRNKPVIISDSNGSITETDLSQYCTPKFVSESIFPFLNCIETDRNMWLIPHSANNILKVDKKNGQIIREDYFADYFKLAKDTAVKFLFCGLHNGKIWLIPGLGNSLFYIDVSTDKENVLRLTKDKDCNDSSCKYINEIRNVFAENAIVDLDTFCDSLHKATPQVNREQSSGTNGHAIYDYVKGLAFGRSK